MAKTRHAEDANSIARLIYICLKAGWHMRELEEDTGWLEDYSELDDLLKDATEQCTEEHGSWAKTRAILMAEAIDEQLNCRI